MPARDCVAIERGPLVYCFEQADQLGGIAVDELTVRSGGLLGERRVTLPGVGETIQVTAEAVESSGVPRRTGRTARTPRPRGTPITAVAIPYFQWDNRDGHAMRVWMPRSDG